MTTASPRYNSDLRTSRPPSRCRTRASALAFATGLLFSGIGAGTASAQELPTDQVQGAAEGSAEYAGYIGGSVEAFFQLPPDEAVGGSAVAGSVALCVLLPTPDDTCVI